MLRTSRSTQLLVTGDGSGGQNSTSFIPYHFVVRSDPYPAFSYSPCRCGSNGKSHVSFSFAITVPVNRVAYVGFGKTEQPKSVMVDADIIFLWRRGNVNYFKDSYSVNFNPAPDAVDDLFGKSWSAFTVRSKARFRRSTSRENNIQATKIRTMPSFLESSS